eukprot:TRINITY_DN7856_c0_g2_i4.p1 TRINITY_DN7856_c0_g2~~TRINITY_DN7856_c0_g2_i4.p1  ORF type:complete len:162 (-),score=30.82 TRINITY_DN7856_c0_g2_i4:1565-2050(-)
MGALQSRRAQLKDRRKAEDHMRNFALAETRVHQMLNKYKQSSEMCREDTGKFRPYILLSEAWSNTTQESKYPHNELVVQGFNEHSHWNQERMQLHENNEEKYCVKRILIRKLRKSIVRSFKPNATSRSKSPSKSDVESTELAAFRVFPYSIRSSKLLVIMV